MLIRKLPLFLVVAGWLTYVAYDDPNLHIVPLHWIGLYAAVLGFLLIPIYHIVSYDKKQKMTVQKPKSFVLYAGIVLLLLSALSYYFVSNDEVVCSGDNFSCFGPFFFFTIPSAILGAIMLLISMLTNKTQHRKK